MSKMHGQLAPAPVPDHVDPSLVVDFDAYDPPNGRSDLHLSWKTLQDEAPGDVIWTPRNGGHWILLRGNDIHAAIADERSFSNRLLLIPRVWGEQFKALPITMEAPASIKYRSLMNQDFSPKRVRALGPKIAEIARSIVEEIAPKGRCEVIEDYTSRLPMSLFMQLADLPADDAPRLFYLASQLTKPDGTMTLEEASAEIIEYLVPIVERRRTEPGDDIISRFSRGRVDDQIITGEAALDLASITLFGGLDTIASSLGFAFKLLATSPAHRRQLVDEPALIPAAVDEIFRRFAVGFSSRLVTKDTEIAGVHIKADDMVLLPLMLHGLDEREYADPMRIDFKRPPGPISTFGNGHHLCVGRFLGKMEMQVAIEEWLQVIPDFEVAPGHAVTMTSGAAMAIDALPLVWSTESISLDAHDAVAERIDISSLPQPQDQDQELNV